MGKASSSKKVARAARAGGQVRSDQRKLGFPVAVAAIVLLGVGLVFVARQGFTDAAAESPGIGDHWHAAYGFYVCDTFLPPLSDAKADTTGIHTHGDGLIHIHPFSGAHAGKNATLSKWGEVVGVRFGSTSFELEGGVKYDDSSRCGDEPASVKVYKWPADDPSGEPEIFDGDIGKVRLDTNRAAYTIAVVPDGAEVPRPESVATLDQLDPITDDTIPQAPPDPSELELTPPGAEGEPVAPGGESPAGDAPAGTDAGAGIEPTEEPAATP
jgi:hypothetical protein